MDGGIVTALVGVGMFLLGYFTHGWVNARSAQAVAEAGPSVTRWSCGGCGRVKELPTELDTRVLVCNNCQMRLHRLDGGAAG